jgi:hypothetical protein
MCVQLGSAFITKSCAFHVLSALYVRCAFHVLSVFLLCFLNNLYCQHKDITFVTYYMLTDWVGSPGLSLFKLYITAPTAPVKKAIKVCAQHFRVKLHLQMLPVQMVFHLACCISGKVEYTLILLVCYMDMCGGE